MVVRDEVWFPSALVAASAKALNVGVECLVLEDYYSAR